MNINSASIIIDFHQLSLTIINYQLSLTTIIIDYH